jgi:hypothetical protein
MPIADGTHKTAARICDALGLKDVRDLSLSMAVDDAVMLRVTQYVTGDQMDRFAGELESRQYVLVPHEWTPVGERLPLDISRVWVSCPQGLRMADYTHQRWFEPGHLGINGVPARPIVGVTHWMPVYEPKTAPCLPAPPEVK